MGWLVSINREVHSLEITMSKPEWGIKRRCLSCGGAFYDLDRTPILCPKCDAEFKPETLLKSRRSRPEEPPPPVKPVPVKAPEEAAAEEEEIAEEELIEDAAELGEDEDDMAEVIEKGDEPRSD
jgi:uncharacterized protein (TIGR02300 family)